jgi:hypothetical protein
MSADELAAVVNGAEPPAGGKKPKRRQRVDERVLEAVEELNQRHALVLVGDRALVLCERADDKGRPELGFLPPEVFRVWYGTEKLFYGSARPQGLGSIWIEHPRRRQYDGICFAPEGAPASHYNLWRGFSVEPRSGVLQEVCPTFCDHLLTNIAGGKQDDRDWIFGWFAHMIQRPAERIGTSLVLRGLEGTGKTKLGEIMGSLIDPHYLLVDSARYITGQFNSHLANCLLLQADEGFWAGDRAAEGVLKSLITSSRQMIERKGVDPVPIRNLVRLMITSNEDWVVPAGLEARRFAIFEVGKAAMQNAEYFAEIDREMAAGGREVLLHCLLHFDLDKVNVRQVPSTEALVEQKLMSLRTEVNWWRSRLLEGAPTARHSNWPDLVPTESLYSSYVAFADTIGLSRKLGDEQLATKLRRLVPPGSLVRVRRTVSFIDDDGLEVTRRKWCLTLARLDECRRHFDELMKAETLWDPEPEG